MGVFDFFPKVITRAENGRIPPKNVKRPKMGFEICPERRLDRGGRCPTPRRFRPFPHSEELVTMALTWTPTPNESTMTAVQTTNAPVHQAKTRHE
jgi:hypothetical protein